jgi:hypothetical protein
MCWNSPCTITAVMAAHMPPAEAPENTSIETSCRGTAKFAAAVA